ncbi:MAG: Bug family tripartite tricarboxylate transporter substrate binding protein [Burkholderiaceae bacterium]
MIKAFFVAVMLAAITMGPARAQDYPNKLVRISHPYSAGSGPDIAARVLAEHLSAQWSQQVIVEARPGASGFIGLEAAKKAPADGHHLTLIGLAHMAMNPGLYKKLPYDWERDFGLIGLIFRTPFFVTVRSGDKYRSVADLIAASKRAPGSISYATPYVGSPIHLGAALFESMTGTRMLHVPYNDQTQVFVSIANGDVDWTLGTVGSAGALLRGGKVKLLAIASDKRLASQPDVPTVEESGGPAGYEVDSWVGLATPAGTPAWIRDKINADLARALADPKVLERFRGLGYEAAAGSPRAFEELAHKDARKYSELIRRIGVTPQ